MWFLVLGISLFLQSAFAQTVAPCSSALHEQKNVLPALFEKPEPLTRENAQDLVISLLQSNSSIFFNAKALADEPSFLKNLRVTELKALAPHEHYPYYRATLATAYRGKEQSIPVFFRSNGHTAFLSSTWQLEQERERVLKPMAVFRDRAKGIETISQARTVLNTLPDKVSLSRVMSTKEFELWKSGDLSKIKTRMNALGGAWESKPKTTFALNHYRFNNSDPYVFEIDRSKLLELEEQGLLSVNTYEDVANSKLGIGPEGQTSFGIEVEIVIHGLEGRKQILEMMRSPLQVPQ